MSDMSNDVSTFGVIPYINGLALQVAYPNASGQYWIYNGSNGGFVLPPSVAHAIDDAGLELNIVGRTAPSISPGSQYFASRNLTARLGNNAMVDAANVVRSEYGVLVRNIGMDLTSIPGRPYNLVEGVRIDLSYQTFSLKYGRTINLDEVKAKNLLTANDGAQLQQYADLIESINARSSGMRTVGSTLKVVGKFAGPVGLAYDLYNTGRDISADLVNNDAVGVGRDVAQFGGRWAGMTAGASLGAWGYAAGPVVGTITTIGGGIAGTIIGERGITAAYNAIFGQPADVSGISKPADLARLSPQGTMPTSATNPANFARQNLWQNIPLPQPGTTNTNSFYSPVNFAYPAAPQLAAPQSQGLPAASPDDVDAPGNAAPRLYVTPCAPDECVLPPLYVEPADISGDTGDANPVVLDLTGKGINIFQLGSSNTFMNAAGDGEQHRTAWAGAGNGVLMFDANGDGNVDDPNDFEFTRWDPTATSDMQALADVFDTNHDGKLDAGDADFSKFKVLVTNADGTTTLETLGQLGIASINLTTDTKTTTLADGSQIAGEATFTRTDGSTGTAADVSFAYDAQGYAVQATTTHNADGSTSIDVRQLNADGSLAGESISTVSADGLSKTLRQDTTGNGIFDSVQTDVTVVNADSSRTETLSNLNGAGVLLNATVTTVSADGKSRTILRDVDGNGLADQSEVHQTNADGSTVVTVSDLDPNESLRDRTVLTTSADGLSKRTDVDHTGSGSFDATQTDVTVVGADGSRTETITSLNADGSIDARSVKVTSADGRTKTTTSDFNGDGIVDLTTTAAIVIAADGSSVTTQTDVNANGSLRDRTITSLSADGLSRTVQTDFDGNGSTDLTTSDVTVLNANGSRTETVTDRNGDGSLLDQSTTIYGADGRSRTVSADSNGDGVIDHLETIVVAADGSSVDTVTDTNANGSLRDKTVTTASADGLSRT